MGNALLRSRWRMLEGPEERRGGVHRGNANTPSAHSLRDVLLGGLSLGNDGGIGSSPRWLANAWCGSGAKGRRLAGGPWVVRRECDLSVKGRRRASGLVAGGRWTRKGARIHIHTPSSTSAPGPRFQSPGRRRKTKKAPNDSWLACPPRPRARAQTQTQTCNSRWAMRTCSRDEGSGRHRSLVAMVHHLPTSSPSAGSLGCCLRAPSPRHGPMADAVAAGGSARCGDAARRCEEMAWVGTTSVG